MSDKSLGYEPVKVGIASVLSLNIKACFCNQDHINFFFSDKLQFYNQSHINCLVNVPVVVRVIICGGVGDEVPL